LGLWIIFYPKLQTTTPLENTILVWESLSIPVFWLGVGLALVAVFFHSLSTLLVKKYNDGIPNLHIVAGTAWICAVLYLLINPYFLLEWPSLPSKSLLAIAYLGSFGSVIGFILYYYLLNHMDAVSLGLMTLITPVIALLLGYFLNEEPLNAAIAIGAGLVILGLVCYEFGSKLFKQRNHSRQ